MKNYLNYITAALFLSLTVFASCGGSDDPDPEEVDPLIAKAALLSGTATIAENGVSVPQGATATLDWSNLVVTINGTQTGGSINAAGSADETVWPATSTWTFSDTNGTSITRGDDVVIALDVLTESSLSVSFTIDAPTSARTGIVEGEWGFTFNF